MYQQIPSFKVSAIRADFHSASTDVESKFIPFKYIDTLNSIEEKATEMIDFMKEKLSYMKSNKGETLSFDLFCFKTDFEVAQSIVQSIDNETTERLLNYFTDEEFSPLELLGRMIYVLEYVSDYESLPELEIVAFETLDDFVEDYLDNIFGQYKNDQRLDDVQGYVDKELFWNGHLSHTFDAIPTRGCVFIYS